MPTPDLHRNPSFSSARSLLPRGRGATFVACLALVLGACNDDESDAPETPRETTRPSPSQGNEGKPTDASKPTTAKASRFIVGARIFDDVQTNSYFHVLPSLEEGTAVDEKQSLEIPGPAKLFSLEQAKWFAIGDGEAPTISHYTLDEQDELQAGRDLTLHGHGVESLWDTLYYVSETKAYYPDRDGGQLIILNPRDMRVEGTIALPQTQRKDYLALYGYTAVVRGSKLLFSVGWFDWEKDDRILPETGLVVLDTATDTVERFDVDTRCGGISQAVTTSSGDAYFISSALAAAAHRLERLATEPCALKIAKGADAFDPDYLVKLAEVTGHPMVGEPVGTGTDQVFLRVMEDEKAEVTKDSLTIDLTGQLLWQWWKWDLKTNTASVIDSVPPATADVLAFKVGDKVYGAQATEDYSETTLIELTAKDAPKTALTVPGFAFGVVEAPR